MKEAALLDLVAQNSEKSKTKHIKFETLQMREYLKSNKNTTLSKTIFSVRAGTLDIKVWNSWYYENTLCAICEMSGETIDTFLTCRAYGKTTRKIDWKEIFLDNVENQITVAKEVKRRLYFRKKKLDEVGLPLLMAPLLQSNVEQI